MKELLYPCLNFGFLLTVVFQYFRKTRKNIVIVLIGTFVLLILLISSPKIQELQENIKRNKIVKDRLVNPIGLVNYYNSINYINIIVY